MRNRYDLNWANAMGLRQILQDQVSVLSRKSHGCRRVISGQSVRQRDPRQLVAYPDMVGGRKGLGVIERAAHYINLSGFIVAAICQRRATLAAKAASYAG